MRILQIGGSVDLNQSIQMFISSKINMSFKYGNSDGFINGVTHRNQLYYTQIFVNNCGNLEDNYYIEVANDFDDYFRITMTINEIRYR